MTSIYRKTILIFSVLISTFIGCNAQHIIPTESFYSYGKNLVDGDYIKDVNGVLNKYVGTWSGTYENNKFTFEIKKSTLTHNGYTRDLLYVKYQILDINGKEVINTLSLSDDNFYTIKGLKMDKDGWYKLIYQGYESDCGQIGQVAISMVPGKDNRLMYLILDPDMDMINCSQVAKQLLPTKTPIVLTKQ